MRRLIPYLLLAFVVLLFIGGGCPPPTLEKPSVTFEVIDTGAAIRFTWTKVEDAEGYYIYVDDKKYSTKELTYDVRTPAKEIKITAYANGTESEAYILDCKPVLTEEIEVYFMSEPDPKKPSGFGFKADGSAAPFSVTEEGDKVDYTVEDRVPVGKYQFFSPNAYPSPINPKKNMTNEPSISGEFDDLKIALAPKNYITQREIAEGGIYALFMDRDNDGWDTGSDYFAKVLVKDIDPATKTVKLKLAFQKITGLRWLVTK